MVQRNNTQVHHFTHHLWFNLSVDFQHIQPRTNPVIAPLWIREALERLTSYTFLSYMLSL